MPKLDPERELAGKAKTVETIGKEGRPPKLDAEKERKLVCMARSGDEQSREQLVRAHEWLFQKLAAEVCVTWQCWDLQSDLEAEGKKELDNAVMGSFDPNTGYLLSGFDPNKGYRLSTYACKRIQGAMKDYVRVIKFHLTRSQWELAADVRVAHNELMHQLYQMPTSDQIAAHLTISVTEVRVFLQHRELLLANDTVTPPKAESIAKLSGLPLRRARRIERVRSDIERKSKSPISEERIAKELEDRIAKRLIVDRQSVDDALRTLIDGVAPEPDDIPVDGGQVAKVLHNEWIIVLGKAVNSLPNGQRDVIALRLSEDLTDAEIAERLEMNINNVKSNLKRGLETLRSHPLVKKIKEDRINSCVGGD